MGAIGEEELIKWDMLAENGGGGEKILVLVRLRPLNEKEISRNEVSEWECINETTILFRNRLQDRSGYPSAYTFDRVFSGDKSTRQVYDEGAKEIALSVVTGINSTIFAYGQTSSGKTYTMIGITEYAVADIYDYIHKHQERAFVLKLSAVEIYNEVVRDLLTSDNTPLRLLDDPEKGTVVEKLTEETLRDWNHLKELLSICEAQRKIGETSLNETSSRSHQIIRLTIESSAREFIGKDKSTTLVACVNFVDLAGSERASQALSVGNRLKEGCHINRSLLTLGTVIRKLSKGRNVHINYRDSKLTRILQPSLGGNARTAIICTLCPARSHVEQTRNALLFASCAKEVTTNAQVNVVMSDKALVKHLQKELARLENELRAPPTPSSTCNCSTSLRKKDLQIDRLEKEVRELNRKKDLAEARVEDLLHIAASNEAQRKQNGISHYHSRWKDEDVESSASASSSSSPLPAGKLGKSYFETGDYSNGVCKDVPCIEVDNEPAAKKHVDVSEPSSHSPSSERGVSTLTEFPCEEIQSSDQDNSRYSEVDSLATPPFEGGDYRNHMLRRNWSFESDVIMSTPTTPQHNYTPPPNGGYERNFTGRPKSVRTITKKLLRNNSQSSMGSSVADCNEEIIPSVDTFVAGLKQMAKQQVNMKDIGLDPMQQQEEDMSLVQSEFEKQRKAIIELWEICNVSIIHRTYFFLLFKGNPADSVYMEVEFRRLNFLKDAFSQGSHAVEAGRTLTLASSEKELNREKEMLCRLMYKRFSGAERNRLYKKWDISLDSKRRRLQLVNRLWNQPDDLNRIMESAAIVAKLIRFSEQGRAVNEMFGLSFTSPSPGWRSFGWRKGISFW
ncbi:kinesin-like protein KIN-7E [Impatiens glandulifera]|uniref:kinesin-like protein KIN-7E n=1 Tax=Impatiens glandulifera TaxID=253017 RepID=UPI001FB0C91D|nr:kinesin-like protein KIN-7E [Impatiens glandulifera]